MRKTREILRLYLECKLNPRQIAAICKIGKGTVQRPESYWEPLRRKVVRMEQSWKASQN